MSQLLTKPEALIDSPEKISEGSSRKLFSTISRASIWQALAIVACTVVIAIGLVFRFANIDNKFIWLDEACTMTTVKASDSGKPFHQLYGKAYQARQFQDVCLTAAPLSFENFLESVISDRAPNGPFHFLCARLWAEHFGNTPHALRCLSAIFSVLVLPMVFWLCIELFGRRSIAWTCMTLFAISPLQLTYAHEARSYSMVAVVCISGATLLSRACRTNTKTAWWLYGLLQVLSASIHPSMLFVTGLHGVAVLLSARDRMRPFLLSMLLVVTGVAAWLFLVGGGLSNHEDRLFNGWVAHSIPFEERLKRWHMVLPLSFFDCQWTGDTIVREWWRTILLSATAFSMTFCAFKFTGLTRALLLTIPIGFFAILTGADLAQGGVRSITERYLVPALMWMQIAVCATLACGLLSKRRIVQLASVLCLVCLIMVSTSSLTAFNHRKTWWSKPLFNEELKIARYLETVNRPAFACDNVELLIVMSRMVKPDCLVYADRKFKSLPLNHTVVVRAETEESFAAATAEGWKALKHPDIPKCWTLTK